MTQHLPNILRTKTAKAIVLGTLAYSISKTLQYLLKSESRPAITESPLKTLLPILSEQEKGQLPYPIDALPGVRDVSSPYGNIRVYEWGPESGRKVLLIHGISTPCIALRAVAHGLVDKGCRVMLFDLYDVPRSPLTISVFSFVDARPEVVDFVTDLAEDFLTTRMTYLKILGCFVPKSSYV